MKTLANLIAICFVVALVGCQSTQNPGVSPGAVSECGAKEGAVCSKEKSECCMAEQCNREKSECSANKAECEASLGAVSECGAKKSECSAKKAECEASLGAVSECGVKKSECSAAKKAACSG